MFQFVREVLRRDGQLKQLLGTATVLRGEPLDDLQPAQLRGAGGRGGLRMSTAGVHRMCAQQSYQSEHILHVRLHVLHQAEVSGDESFQTDGQYLTTVLVENGQFFEQLTVQRLVGFLGEIENLLGLGDRSRQADAPRAKCQTDLSRLLILRFLVG